MATDTPARLFDRTSPPHILTLVLIASVGAMNMAVFLPSLPSMATYFGTDYEVVQLSVSLYLLATAVLQLVIGPLADHFGRRPVMVFSLCAFIVATVGCIYAPTIEIFLAFRMLQALVSTGIVLSRAIVRDMYPPAESASMIGYVTMGMALVPMFAPMIGGAFEEFMGWQSTFVFLIVSAVLILALVWTDLGETNPRNGMSFRDQLRETPELFRSRRFWGYVAAAAFASGSFFAFLGGAPYVATNVYGLSPFWSGFGFGAPAIGYLLGNFASARLSASRGINRMIVAGTLISSFGIALGVLLAIAGFDGPIVFFACCTSIGLGNGLVIPNSTAGLLSVRPHLAGTASGFGTAAMIGGGSLLSVVAGDVLRLGTGAAPLLGLMLVSSLCAVAAIFYVIWREGVISK